MTGSNKTMIRDMTQGSVTKLLLSFGYPLMLSNLLQTVYTMVDMIVIGQFVGKVGLSAVSIGGDFMHVLTFLVMGFANAGQVILSQYIGAGERGQVKKTIGTVFTVILGCGIVVGALSAIFMNPILTLINTPEEAFADTRRYALTCALGILFIYGYNMISAIMRGMGDSKRPFTFVAVATIVNLVLDLLFVAVFHMGAGGAALATVIGQGVSFIWALSFLYRHREAFGFDFAPKSFIPDPVVTRKLIALGVPMALQNAAIGISMLFVNTFIYAYGVVATAVTGVGGKLGSMASVVTLALSQAGSTMVGQNIGAEKFDRVPKVIGVSMVIDTVVCVTLSLITFIWPRQVFGIFNSEEEVLAMAMTYVPVAVVSLMAFALRSPFFSLINGSGNPALNFLIAIIDCVVARVGLALLMGVVLDMGIMGFWMGSALAGYAPFLIGGIYFCTGRWKVRRV